MRRYSITRDDKIHYGYTDAINELEAIDQITAQFVNSEFAGHSIAVTNDVDKCVHYYDCIDEAGRLIIQAITEAITEALYDDVTNLANFFKAGMARDIGNIEFASSGLSLNLGCGNKQIGNSIGLQLPDWNAEKDKIPYNDESITCIYAFHFFEHIENISFLIKECARVLVYGGLLNIVVPYGVCEMALQDINHKHFFMLKTIPRMIKGVQFYDMQTQSPFQVNFNIVMGVKDSNLAILTQLKKK